MRLQTVIRHILRAKNPLDLLCRPIGLGYYGTAFRVNETFDALVSLSENTVTGLEIELIKADWEFIAPSVLSEEKAVLSIRT
jgi:hypothetical protein